MSEPSDDALLEAWTQGDKAAGNALLERHFQPLYRFFERKVGADADELIQRTLLACAESHRNIRRESTFRTYLFAIARNELYRFFRQRGGEAARLDFGVTSLSDVRTSVTGRLVHKQELSALETAMEDLPLDDQILLELFYVEELDSGALGEILGIEASSVRARLHRARAALERIMSTKTA